MQVDNEVKVRIMEHVLSDAFKQNKNNVEYYKANLRYYKMGRHEFIHPDDKQLFSVLESTIESTLRIVAASEVELL